MSNSPSYRFARHFLRVHDPRVLRTRRHKFVDILMIALCGTIAGADGYVAIVDFARAKEKWFRTFLELPDGIPSHDTIGRLFARIDPVVFAECFAAWTQHLQEMSKGRIIAIDGKQVCGSFDRATGQAAIHMVSAWTSKNSMVLGQVKVDEKSNEITAIPKLLELLDITDSIVTIDAMGTQKLIAQQIIDKKADYILALKNNHPVFYEDVSLFLMSALQNNFLDPFHQPIPHNFHRTIDKDHGRIEVRSCWCTDQIDWLDAKNKWAGFRTIVVVQSERTVNGKTSIELRFYFTSLPPNAKTILNAIRAHWGIENSVHWLLDVAFDEDNSRIRKDNGPQNTATLRHIALNLLKKEKSENKGIQRKRNLAGWNHDYLDKVLRG
jgi:predicted transposase YbfD/YdcC